MERAYFVFYFLWVPLLVLSLLENGMHLPMA